MPASFPFSITRVRNLKRIGAAAAMATSLVSAAAIPVCQELRTVEVRSDGGMVASSERLASQVGAEILRKGGNAVDAAVAVALALAVTYPAAGNLGGGGFMVIRMADGRATAIDYRELAPAAATRNMYLRSDGSPDTKASLEGIRASGVPGT